jgi:DNA gyrase subunit A
VVHIIKAAKTPAEAMQNLMNRFSLDEAQAKAITDMRLIQLTGLNQDKLHQEYDEIEKLISLFGANPF